MKKSLKTSIMMSLGAVAVLASHAQYAHAEETVPVESVEATSTETPVAEQPVTDAPVVVEEKATEEAPAEEVKAEETATEESSSTATAEADKKEEVKEEVKAEDTATTSVKYEDLGPDDFIPETDPNHTHVNLIRVGIGQVEEWTQKYGNDADFKARNDEYVQKATEYANKREKGMLTKRESEAFHKFSRTYEQYLRAYLETKGEFNKQESDTTTSEETRIVKLPKPTTIRVEDKTLDKGTEKLVAGNEGRKEIVERVTLKDGKEIKREVVSEKVTVEPKGDLILVGAKVVETKSEEKTEKPTSDKNQTEAEVPEKEPKCEHAGKADIAFVIDRSSSMEDDIANVRRNLAIFSKKLEEQKVDFRLSVVTFGDYATDSDVAYLRFASGSHWTSDVQEVINALSGLTADGLGYEAHTIPLKQISASDNRFGWRTDKDTQRLVVLLTDETYIRGFGAPTMNEVVSQMTRNGIKTTVVATRTDEYKRYVSLVNEYAPLYNGTGGKFIELRSSNFQSSLDSIVDLVCKAITDGNKDGGKEFIVVPSSDKDDKTTPIPPKTDINTPMTAPKEQATLEAKAATLPETGEADGMAIFSMAAMSILASIGLIRTSRKEN